MLNDRKKKILQLIIEDYISTAEPVGSRTIARKYDLGLSPATIRNEMSDLELLGSSGAATYLCRTCAISSGLSLLCRFSD